MRNRLITGVIKAIGSARGACIPAAPEGRTLMTAALCKGTPLAAAAVRNSSRNSHAKWLLAAAGASAAVVARFPTIEGAEVERTFIAIKPDGVQRGLIADIISRFERKGYKLVAIKLIIPTKDFAEQHYDDLKGRPFFDGLCEFLSSGPVVAMVWEGQGVIKYGRKLIGATSPHNSEPGTIRGDLAISVGRNIIHGSDGPETAKAEIGLWFKPEELLNYTLISEKWLYES